MKLIESKVEYLPQGEGLNGIYKQIEIAGRVAYQSLDKITDDSAKGFVDRMIKSKHGAALEHGTVYLMAIDWDCNPLRHYINNKYSRYREEYLEKEKCQGDVSYKYAYYITTNLRVLVENGWLDDLKYLCEPTENHEKRHTFKFTCSRAIAQELTRHRVFSFLMESQRYINYSKERHGGEITFIKPTWLPEIEEGRVNTIEDINIREDIEDDKKLWIAACLLGTYMDTEKMYFEALKNGATPQQARDVLPNATKTELIMTGFASDWRYLLDLRLFGKTGNPHPDMVNLMEKLRYEALEAGIWYDIMKYPSEFK